MVATESENRKSGKGNNTEPNRKTRRCRLISQFKNLNRFKSGSGKRGKAVKLDKGGAFHLSAITSAIIISSNHHPAIIMSFNHRIQTSYHSIINHLITPSRSDHLITPFLSNHLITPSLSNLQSYSSLTISSHIPLLPFSVIFLSYHIFFKETNNLSTEQVSAH